MKRHKVYAVEFIQYNNCMRNTVWCEEDDEYLDVGKGAFLILEEDIDKYKKFGHGIKTLTYVGDILLRENHVSVQSGFYAPVNGDGIVPV